MIGKIILFIYTVGISNAVFVDHTSVRDNKDFAKTNRHAWQMVKVYHPPSQAHGYSYEPYAYPKYEFEYSVSDKKTGDHKHHHEARDGDQVRGEYSLVESDGSLRKVQYHADDHSGFNAIVSKTVNKHGDHAISLTDHTRFFYPVGHNVKINHYFPGKDYHSQDNEKPESNNNSIPVHEESPNSKSDEGKMLVFDAGNKLMVLEPVKFEEQSDETTNKKEAPKTDAVEAVPVQVVPAIVSAIPQNIEENKVFTEDIKPEPMIENAKEISPKELTSAPESEKLGKANQDSEVASSFYHSNFYYVGF